MKRFVDDLWRDIRYAIRTLVKQPAFTAMTVITLALGIGANTAIFTLFDALLLRSLPVRDPGRLVLFTDSYGQGTRTGSPAPGRWEQFSTDVYEFLSKQRLPYQSLAALRSGEDAVSVRMPGVSGSSSSSSSSQIQPAQAHLVSGTYFTVMGVEAAIGRTLGLDDDRPNASPVAVVSDGFWKQRLNADPAAVGTVAVLNNTAFTIVGVTPPEFFGERVSRPPDFFVPIAFQPQVMLRPSLLVRPDAYWLNLIGRLPKDGTRAQAQTATTVALRQFLTDKEGAKLTEVRARREIQDARIELVSGAGGVSGLRQLYSQPLHNLLVVVALVLLIACANVGSLLLSRSAARRGEISLRIALGASRTRLIRQLLTESLVLAAIGATSGVLLVRWVIDALLAIFVSRSSPIHATLNASVLIFTVCITALAGILFGLAPALAAGRGDLLSALKSGGAGGGRRRRALGATGPFVVGQIAVSLVLLVGASLFARSLLNLENQNLGFDQDHMLLAPINPRLAGYKPTEVAALYRAVYDRLNVLPRIRSATLARYSPLSGRSSVNDGSVQGYSPGPGESVSFETILVGPSYPETLGVPVVLGRPIGLRDDIGIPKVAMVNEAFVRHFLPNDNPIGHHFGIEHPGDFEIVGVLKDAQFHDVKDEIKPVVFLAYSQDSSQSALDCEIEVRTAGDAGTVFNEVRQAVAEIDRNLTIAGSKTLRGQVESTFDSQRLAGRLVSFFGGLALLLACVGLYGVVAQGVVRRTKEIGVRMALGARRRDVLWMILRETLGLLAVGLMLGVLIALGAGRLVASQLYGLKPADPISFAIAAAILASVAVVTGLLPARRASRVDPMIALRCE